MFCGQFAMNDPCPECGLVFQREEGYFLGAMFVSYTLGAGFVIPAFFLAQWLLPTWSGYLLGLLVWLLYLPLVPAVFRYSRVMWVHLERWGCFSELTANPYERYRIQQRINQQQAAQQAAQDTPASR
jgi:hypothetical protein